MSKKINFKNSRAKNEKETFKRLLKYMLKEKKSFIIGMICMLLSLISIIATSILTGPIAENLENRDLTGVKNSIYILSFSIFLTIIFTFLGNLIFAVLSQKISYRIRDQLFNHIQKLSISFFDKNKSGEIVSLFTNDIGIINIALDQSISKTILSVLQIIISVIILFIINVPLTIISLTLLGMYIFLIRFFGNKNKKYTKITQKLFGNLTSYSEEMISSLPIIKSYNYQKESNKRFKTRAKKLKKYDTLAVRYGIIMSILGQHFSFIIKSVVIFLGLLLYTKNVLDIANLMIYIRLISSLTLPVQNISNYLALIYSAIACAERVFDILDLDPEINEGNVVLTEKDGITYWDDKGKLTPAKGKVEFKNVFFDYNKSKTEKENMTLKNISFTANPKERVAIVGSTGAGKTTITNLIDRFYEISDGSILIDNIPIEKIAKSSLRKIITVVIQEPKIFTDTVLENIQKGNLNASKEEIIHASKLTNADFVISRLPKQYDTKISSKDVSLSRGEKQLISIARAAVSKPLILMLDEATSSIDSITEELIKEGFSNLMSKCTTIVIAHRISTIRDSNEILVIDDGKIIEKGTHDELVAKNGKYYKLSKGLEVLD